MRIAELIDGLTIISKYEPDADVDAQHDEVFAGAYNPDAMTQEDRERMAALGWGESYDSWRLLT